MRHHHIEARDVRVGDILLTTSAVNQAIVFADEVEDIWSYDEVLYFRSDGDTFRYDHGDTLTVLRTSEGFKRIGART